jgi:hypothetical protein
MHEIFRSHFSGQICLWRSIPKIQWKMDFKRFCKIIKDKAGVFYLNFLFQPNRTKNEEMRAKNQNPYNFQQHYTVSLTL